MFENYSEMSINSHDNMFTVRRRISFFENFNKKTRPRSTTSPDKYKSSSNLTDNCYQKMENELILLRDKNSKLANQNSQLFESIDFAARSLVSTAMKLAQNQLNHENEHLKEENKINTKKTEPVERDSEAEIVHTTNQLFSFLQLN